MVGLGQWQWHTQARVRQHEIVVHLEQSQLLTQSGFVFAQGVDPPTERRHMADKALDGAPSGARDVVATFGFALAFWQPSLTCSLDNPLILLAESWIVGKS